MSRAARATAAVGWFGALAVLYGLALGPAEGSGGDRGETLVLAGLLVASAVPGVILGVPALLGPPAGVALLFVLYAAGVELPVFVSSALWAVGAFFVACVELLGAAAGLGVRALVESRRRPSPGGPEPSADATYNRAS